MNVGQLIKAESIELATEEAEFATPESVRNAPIRDMDAIMAFQGCVATLDLWPLAEPLTEWDAKLISKGCEYDAQTEYLNHLATF